MTPPSELKARILAAAAREPSPVRRRVERRRALSWSGAALWMLLVFGAIGGMRAVERPVAFVLGTAAGWAGIAFGAARMSARGPSMLGRPRRVLLLVAALTPLALEAWYSAWISRSGIIVAPDLGVAACVVATLGMALAPFAVLLLGRRGSDPNHPRATAAAIGAVSGAWGAVLIDLHCDHADLLHVTLGHVLPAALLSLVGLLVGARLLGVRAQPGD